MASERTGLLVIRTWREPDSPVPFRAEVRVARDVSKGFQRNVTLFDADTVLHLVADWLSAVVGDQDD